MFSRSPVWGLDYTFTVTRSRALGAARLVSTPSRQPLDNRSAGMLGSGLPVTGFPDFEQFCIQGFPGSTQTFKSLASTNFATPANADL
jgi:hypothetical protein